MAIGWARHEYRSPLRLLLTPLLLAALTSGCSGPQSALESAGPQAHQLAQLFWWMTAGTAVIWIAMIALTLYAVRAKPNPEKDARRARLLIVVGGAVIPTTVLAVLLAYGLAMLPAMVAPAPEGSLKVTVIGEQWWWRVVYDRDGQRVELANEVRMPVNEPVQFELRSSNVIHAFWIPSLGGKRDMIPGRVTQLALTATKTGLFRGVCAEYCGTSHALMSFMVEVMERDAFDEWLERESRDRIPAEDETRRRGEAVFLQNGCGACHSVRGTSADGVIAPDLTHVGSRYSLGAGVLTNDIAALEKWIANPNRIKPDAHMPAFGMLPGEDQRALAAYLKGLE